MVAYAVVYRVALPDTVAAVIGEPIHGAGGLFFPTDDYWPLVRDICSRHEVLLIADEIITGFCRTGRWFCMSHWDVTPDIMPARFRGPDRTTKRLTLRPSRRSVQCP